MGKNEENYKAPFINLLGLSLRKFETIASTCFKTKNNGQIPFDPLKCVWPSCDAGGIQDPIKHLWVFTVKKSKEETP